MRHRVLVVGVTTLLMLTGAVAIKAQIEEHPGYFPLDQFGILTDDSLSLEINLNKAMLDLVAVALGGEEPEFAELVSGLESIRVRIAPSDSFDTEEVRSRVSEASRWLTSHDWSTMLRLREDDEEIYVYTRLSGGELQGIAVLAIEEAGDTVLINVVGSLSPERMAALAEALDVPELGLAVGRGSSDDDGEDD